MTILIFASSEMYCNGASSKCRHEHCEIHEFNRKGNNTREMWNSLYKDKPHWDNGYSPEIDHFEECVPKGKVLDLACGSGRNSVILKELGYDPIGLDFADEAIKKAKERESGIHFIVGDGEQMPFPDEHFDSIFCLYALQFMDMRKAIPEMHRVLKKEGTLYYIEFEKTVHLDDRVDIKCPKCCIDEFDHLFKELYSDEFVVDDLDHWHYARRFVMRKMSEFLADHYHRYD